MATVAVVFGTWHGKQPIMARRTQSEALTTTAGVVSSGLTGISGDEAVEVATSGADIWVTLDGTTPAVGTGFFLPDGTTRTFDAGVGMVVKIFG